MKDFGTHLAIEHLKTDYAFFLIGALTYNKEKELVVKAMSSLDFGNESQKVIEKEIAAKMIEHLQKYV